MWIYIYANKHLGTDRATECRKVWAIKEDARRCGRKRRECIFPRKRWEKGEQAGKGGSCVIQQEKGRLVRSDKEKSKIKQERIEALDSGGGFHSFPGHCAVQSGQRNLPSLIPSSPLPSFLSHPPSAAMALQATETEISQPSLHLCKAAKKQHLVKEKDFLTKFKTPQMAPNEQPSN